MTEIEDREREEIRTRENLLYKLQPDRNHAYSDLSCSSLVPTQFNEVHPFVEHASTGYGLFELALLSFKLIDKFGQWYRGEESRTHYQTI